MARLLRGGKNSLSYWFLKKWKWSRREAHHPGLFCSVRES